MARFSFSGKTKFTRIAAVCLMLILLLYIIATWSEDKKRHFSDSARNEPQLVNDLGNFEPRNVKPREGPGENGKPHILRQDQQNDADQSETEYGINIVCSDEISVDRAIPDTRLPECKYWDYPKDLPTVSVIIVYYNERWSVLLRTVHSVINRSPKHILKEILLVDDFSDKEHLQSYLDNYIERFHGVVRLIRNTQREGLIRAKSRGAKEAKGEVIVFLDAHCEVNTNWLPPLLAPIYRDHTVLTVPIIDRINHKTFEYRPANPPHTHYRGIFEWGMLYKETEVPQRELSIRKHNSEPYKSPTHAGGLFAIYRKYFLMLGAYDTGLLVWGGENFELSFKVWQCGGSIEWVPCSRVGHVYRRFVPYNVGKLAQKRKGPLVTINYKRVIETWFDDKYKEYFYTREPLARFLDMGDISEQETLKKRWNCKSFEWFMQNVAYDVVKKFPELPPNLHWGELRSGAVSKCIGTLGFAPPSLITIQHCHGFGSNQLMRLNTKGQLGVGERCIEADSQGIRLAFCKLGRVDGPWSYDVNSSKLLHRLRNKCMALHTQTLDLSLMPCDINNTYQQWYFKEIHPKW
ncbi:hypothetical protein ILUMI_20650 [Ignelater luminosus]|uniref:Polypeptide N-acetylgalactosaminyltransferase n=1 Tax=Ignelater luminosus TaxID=2038154 RepID=A0A8K0CDP5_IGNLU|nr:hypothetical protein ILUMI_20650 [Ignelater luminosus]